MKRIAIGAKRHRLGLSVQVCVWMRRPQGGASQLCHRLSTRANGSLRSTLHVIRHIRYEGEGGVRITNQQKVRLINSHANWLAEMHSCTLQASHLYNIYIPISYTSAGLIPASLPTAVSYISRHSNHSAISMPYPAFVSAWGLIDFHLIHFSDGLKCWKRYSALNKMAALWRRRLDPPSLSFLIS